MTKQQLKDELKQSMLAKNTVNTSVLRMLISAIGYEEIKKAVPAGRQGGANYEATEEDVMAVVQREVKQHKDSIEQYKAGNREDLVAKEQQELDILEKYMPEQMNEEEIKKLVSEAVLQSGASTPQDMGKVMAVLMPKVKGKADGSLVSKLVKEALS